MFPKEFIIENGIVYYRKKPLHKQPLFWTSLVAGTLTFFLGIAVLLLLLTLGVSEAFSQLSNYDSYSNGYNSSGSHTYYTEYEVGETASLTDLDVTVVSIEKDGTLELVDASYSQALVVTVELENTSDTDYYFDEYAFSLIDPIYEDSYWLDYRTYDVNIPEKIEVGETLTVKLIYGVDNETSFFLRFEDAEWYQAFADSL